MTFTKLAKFRNNPSFQMADKVRNISAEFLSNRGLTLFSYIRVYDDTSSCYLTTHPQLAFDFFDLDFYKQITYEKTNHLQQSSIILWVAAGANDTPIAKHYSDNLGVANGITLIKRQMGYSEQFCFATTPDNITVNNYYLANIDEFYNFGYYFKEQARSLIKEVTAQRVADELGIALRTIKSYLENIKNKININNKKELIDFYRSLF